MTSQIVHSKRTFIGQLLSMNLYLISLSSSHFFIPPLISFPLSIYPPIHPSLLCLSPPSPVWAANTQRLISLRWLQILAQLQSTLETVYVHLQFLYIFPNPCCQSKVTMFQNLMRLFQGCLSPAVPAPLSLYRSSLSGDERITKRPSPIEVNIIYLLYKIFNRNRFLHY